MINKATLSFGLSYRISLTVNMQRYKNYLKTITRYMVVDLR